MKCQPCNGNGMTGYDQRGRPKPCWKCRGTGWIGPEPEQFPTYTALVP